MESSDKTYKMQFTCHNCKTTNIVDIPKGTDAHGLGGTCCYCGIIDSGNFIYNKPDYILRSIAMQNVYHDNYCRHIKKAADVKGDK